MKIRALLILFLIFTVADKSQNIRALNPNIGKIINYTAEGQSEWERIIEIAKKESDDYSKYSPKERELIDQLETGSGPITVGSGCSWYCGGGPYIIKASSTLESTKHANYKVENIHDFNLFTAWCPGKSNTAIGEYIEFFFKSGSPRVNEIIVYDGYSKNENLWKKNARVKRFKLYINNKPYAFLDLADVSAPQTFRISPVRSNTKNVDMVFKFEIIDVYPGTEYSDVAVSEINFNGLDVHCFGRGTKVNQPGNKFKNIEEIVPGDTVMCISPRKEGMSPVVVERTEKAYHNDLVKYVFENGDTLISTRDHPFVLEKKGWSSLLPEKTKKYKSFPKIQTIEVGDLFGMIGSDDKWTTNKLIRIESLAEGQETYTISKVHSGNNFMVNSLLVGVEEL